ncbi:hypothetical protein ABZ281_23495 [Streptomyces sp. NPDC006265]|uniref:hypothetical protein n=1 Tax=Streptomyces sp. NPDC006265 TaxID=3156740 RepID=UPI0033B415E0
MGRTPTRRPPTFTYSSTNGGLYTLSAASVLAVLGVAFVRHTHRGERTGSGGGEIAAVMGKSAVGEAR